MQLLHLTWDHSYFNFFWGCCARQAYSECGMQQRCSHVYHAGSALVRVHSALSVLAARKLLPELGSFTRAEPLQTMTSKVEAILCALFCLCRRAQLDPSAVASCPPVLLTYLWILLAFHR